MVELSTENVLHPRQVVELNEQKKQLSAILSAPPHISGQLQDSGGLVRKKLAENDALLRQAAKPLLPEEIDEAVKAEKQLRESWLQGMPTKAEMRRNPPGAVDKNIAWSRNKKKDVLKWKNLRRRLHASGISEHRLADEGDISNIEMYRPDGGSGEMNMDNAQITGKDLHIPSFDNGLPTVLSDSEITKVKEIDPDINLAVLDNEQRAAVKEFINGLTVPSRESDVNVHAPGFQEGADVRRKPRKTRRKKQNISSEERKARSDRMKARHAAKRAAQEA